MAAFAGRGSRITLGIVLWLIGTLPFLTRLHTGWTSWDLGHYLVSTRAFLDGAGIYTAVPFEYPPYALAWFAGPAAIAHDVTEFRLAFGLLIWTLDAGIKAALLWEGLRGRERHDLLPFVLYTLTTTALGHILLQRFDIIPAALSVAAVIAFARGWTGTAGAVTAVAAGTKLYPALWMPVMLALAWRRHPRHAMRFGIAAAVALAPLALTTVWGPWWRFASGHTSRGLEAESLWASLIWLFHNAGVPAEWGVATAWIEVTGPVAAAIVAPARGVWAIATIAAVAIATRAALRGRVADASLAAPPAGDRAAVADLAALLLMPTLAFVALGLVLSPQYHLWLAPLAALAFFGRRDPSRVEGARSVTRALWCVVVSGWLVPVFFPSPTFDTGLDLGRTLVLVLRNALLVYALWSFVRTYLASAPITGNVPASGTPIAPEGM